MPRELVGDLVTCADMTPRLFQFWSAYVPCGAQYLDAVQIALEQVDTVRRMVSRYPSYTAFATSARGAGHCL